MIVIFSIEGDKSTDEVIDWLNYFGAIWERINAEEFGKGNLHQIISKISLLKKECKVVWYRKWSNAFLLNDDTLFNTSDKIDLIKEFKAYSNFLFNSFKNAYWLNNPSNLELDKLSQLTLAKDCGIEVPSSLYTSSPGELRHFFNKKKFVITKNLDANIIRHEQGETFMGYTKEIDLWFYIAEVKVPNNLQSSYGKPMDALKELSGEAEIITADLSALERILYFLRRII